MGVVSFFDIILMGVFKSLTIVDKGREGGKNYLKFVDIINGRPPKE